MRRLRCGSALKRFLGLALGLLIGCACNGPGGAATHSPSQIASSSRSASPSASTSGAVAYGVLVTPQDQPTYQVSLVGVDGKVAATAGALIPGAAPCVVPLPVSTSNTRVYFMDPEGIVRFLLPNGDTGRATTVPADTVTRRSMFAVSPDDQRIAVIVVDFTAGGASTRLYVEDLNGGGNHVNTFSETGAYSLWPTGWHGTNNLVVAKVPACMKGSGSFGPLELHVVDPMTGSRRFTLGGPTCVIAGPPSPAGAVCETQTQANVLSWIATTTRSFSIQGRASAYLSPDGSKVAIASGTDTSMPEAGRTLAGLQACGWIDDTHVFSAGSVQQPRIADITNGNVTPVNGLGTCGGRIPGGL